MYLLRNVKLYIAKVQNLWRLVTPFDWCQLKSSQVNLQWLAFSFEGLRHYSKSFKFSWSQELQQILFERLARIVTGISLEFFGKFWELRQWPVFSVQIARNCSGIPEIRFPILLKASLFICLFWRSNIQIWFSCL